MKIAILTPTRNRPEGLYRLFNSVNKTMSGLNEIEFMFGVDKDDEFLPEYVNYFGKMKLEAQKNLSVIMIPDVRKPVARIWNDMVKQSRGDWFFNGNDDVIFESKNWDVSLCGNILNNFHPFYVYCFDDGLQHGNHFAFPIVSKEWITAFGYYFPEHFRHNYTDTWIYDIAKKAGVTSYLPDVHIQHLHPSLGYTADKVYIEGCNPDDNERDKILFHATESARAELAEMIKEKIKLYYSLYEN
jgi:hypothetical protein